MQTSAAKDRDTSVAVIGAGIIGLSVAVRLHIAGYKVTVFERDEPMQGCSYGNAGYLSQANIFPPVSSSMLWELPRLLFAADGPLTIRPSYLLQMIPWAYRAMLTLKPEAASRVTRAMAEITRPAYDELEKLAAVVGAKHLLSREGALVACTTNEEIDAKNRLIAEWNAHGCRAEPVTGPQIRELEPALRPSIIGGVFFPGAGRCSNPAGLGGHYAKWLTQNGCQFIKADVRSVRSNHYGTVRIETHCSTSAFDRVVIASGFASSLLLKQLGYRVPLASERGYHLMAPQKVALRRPVLFPSGYFVATPMENGLRLAGTAEFASPATSANMSRAHQLLTQAAPHIYGIDGTGATSWMGVRPTFPDGMPAIGSATDNPNIIYAFGHGHNGLTLSAATAACVIALINKSALSIDLHPFSLNRF